MTRLILAYPALDDRGPTEETPLDPRERLVYPPQLPHALPHQIEKFELLRLVADRRTLTIP